MASIEKRVRDGQTSWRAHYRTPAGAQRNKTFARKVDAERFLAGVESAKVTGTYVDPALAKVTVGEWASAGWTVRPTSSPPRRSRYEGILRKHVQPEMGPGQARQRLPRRRPGMGHRAGEEPLPGHGPQDPPGAQPDPRHGGQGRPARPQRRQRCQPAAGRQARAPLPDPRAGRRSRHGVRLPGRSTASTAASTPGPTRPTAWSCCSWPTPESGSARWLRFGSAGSTCDAAAP